ncbi:MAG TPA: DUF362 domain-containing protein [Chitinispirillaceae bacterium]|nr:DUF362 domain-containing protein [Chitinispirillaceae bacterium]
MGVNRRGFLKRTGAGAAILVGGSELLQRSAFAAATSRFAEKSDVSFVGSSSSGTRRKMITDVLEPWRNKVAADIAGKTIIIKPNLVCLNATVKKDGDKTLPVTHVDALRGLIDFLRSISESVPIIIGDICAVANPGNDFTTITTGAGYNDLITEYSGVSLMDLSDDTTFPPVNQSIWTTDFLTTTSIPVSSAFTDPKYYIISITRPKTHNCMVMTATSKNILMAAPLLNATVNEVKINVKNLMHGKDRWNSGKMQDENKCLSYNLFQLANFLYPKKTPALAVLDAWEGMEGEGPVTGTSIMQYCAVAGTDPLAVDRLSAKLMGFSDTPTDPVNNETPSYTDMRTLVWMSNAGLGNYDLDKINFILGSITDLEKYVKSYQLHTNYTGNPSYETNWTGGPPSRVLDVSATLNSRYLDPKPLLIPQVENFNNGHITITFSLPVEYKIELCIYNLRGIEVRSLGKEFLSAGRYSVVWNGCDNSGAHVPSGKYVIKMKSGSHVVCDHINITR